MKRLLPVLASKDPNHLKNIEIRSDIFIFYYGAYLFTVLRCLLVVNLFWRFFKAMQ